MRQKPKNDLKSCSLFTKQMRHVFRGADVKTHHYLSDLWEEAAGLRGNYRGKHQHGNIIQGFLKRTTCAWWSKVLYIYTLWETLFPIIKTTTPTVKYGGHCLRYGHALVGKNYLLGFSTLWKTLLPIMLSGREVCMDQGTRSADSLTTRRVQLTFSKVWYVSWSCLKRPIQCQLSRKSMTSELCGWSGCSVFSAGPSVDMYTSLSRCCFCQFDSITVIIMEGTAPDNYTLVFFYKRQ